MSSISVEITRNLNCYFHLVTTSLPKVAHGDEDGDGDNDENNDEGDDGDDDAEVGQQYVRLVCHAMPALPKDGLMPSCSKVINVRQLDIG